MKLMIILGAVIAILFILGYLGIIGKKVILAPEYKGRLVHTDGTAVANTLVTQKISWAGSVFIEETTSDASGVFVFPQRTSKMLLGLILPAETVIVTKIFIETDDGEKNILFISDRDFYADNSTKLSLLCDIDLDGSFESGFNWGVCKLIND